MTEEDAEHWNPRYRELGRAPLDGDGVSARFAEHLSVFPSEGRALEVACGRGRMAVWLAERGLHVHAVDVSSVAIELARDLAAEAGVEDRCRFDIHDLDGGLPAGDPVDLIVCDLFRDARLDRQLVARLAPGGILALACLSEVGAEPGRFRVPAGALPAAFGSFEELGLLASAEGDGIAMIIARRVN